MNMPFYDGATPGIVYDFTTGQGFGDYISLPEQDPSRRRRQEVLDKAADAVLTDRNVAYGNPEDNFADTADLWSAYLGVEIDATDVASLMILLKLARVRTSPAKMDHWTDMAGYAACGAAAAEAEDV